MTTPSELNRLAERVPIADILDRAADLIEPEGAWVQGPFARDAAGNDLFDGRDEGACAWCICGAVEAATRDCRDLEFKAQHFLASLFDDDSYLPQIAWNEEEGRTQTEVVAKLREAASKARADGGGR